MVFRAETNETVVITEPEPFNQLSGLNLGDYACPLCGATKFIQKETIGRFKQGEFNVEEVMYECAGCKKPISGERIKKYFLVKA